MILDQLLILNEIINSSSNSYSITFEQTGCSDANLRAAANL